MRSTVACEACGFMREANATCPRCARIDLAMKAEIIQQSSKVMSPEDEEVVRFAASSNAEDVARIMEASSLSDIDCPRCAERIKARAKMCRFCGLDLEEPDRSPRPSLAPAPRSRSESRLEVVHHYHATPASPGVAAVLSFLLIGLGQMYAGFVGRGLALVFLAVTLGILVRFAWVVSPDGALLAALLWFVVWLVGIVDAYNCASGGDERVTYRGRVKD